MRRPTFRKAALPALAVLTALLAGGAAWWGHARHTGPGPLAEPRTVAVPAGAGSSEIARRLAADGVIAHPLLFQVAARLSGRARALQAGEYAFAPRVSMEDVLAALAAGRTVTRRLTVVEGLTVKQVFALLAAADGLSGPLPPPPGEGRLMPETYFFSLGDSRAGLVARMRRAMDRAVAAAWRRRGANLAIDTPDQAVALASLIERESARPAEYARISAVFHNRLRRGMKLQSDPTVIYALTGGAGPLGRALRRADLEIASPYNTYRRAGLPPEPIAAPGPAALAAALNPASTDDLYFVADGSGGHVFARTLAEHNRNAAAWRRLRRERRPRRLRTPGARSARCARAGSRRRSGCSTRALHRPGTAPGRTGTARNRRWRPSAGRSKAGRGAARG